MSLIFGLDRTATPPEQRAIGVNADGNLELTAEIDSSGLATLAKQDEQINATNRQILNTGGIGDGSVNATSVCLGYDRTNGQGRSILVDSAGRQLTAILGNTEGDGSGTFEHLHTDGNGNLNTQIISTVTTQPSNASNSGVTNDPANSFAVGLRARQTITDSSTETFLKCNASGELLTSSSGGGGGSSANQYNNGGTEESLSVVKPTAPATGLVTPATTILDLQNYKGVAFNVTTTSASFGDLSLGVEFSNASDFSTTLGAGYADIQIFGAKVDIGGQPITGQYLASILMIPELNGQQPLARYARATFNHSNNAGSNISVVINSTQIPH